MSSRCTHTDEVRDVGPRTPDGCEECLERGDRWVCQWRMKMSHMWRLKMSHSGGGDEPQDVGTSRRPLLRFGGSSSLSEAGVWSAR